MATKSAASRVRSMSSSTIPTSRRYQWPRTAVPGRLCKSHQLWLTPLVDLRTAADRLGVHYQTAYRWVREGTLPAVKRGTTYDVDERSLARFQAARAEPSPPPAKSHVRSWDHQVDRLYPLLITGDELGARGVVDRL